ncbi:hypothetical protein E4T38_04002 [Aureobasidium subglaciale]|nr:hypothetical protein E4T38_04002 [Aureobasidium subglaciale]KAI5224832.1 hypothetical protein E4T40_03777 [Aureobasidium subglaciale]KAI5227942.1 hypothetical protein E4T41_03997 [Aureobasidium subglaciale]KAI5263493.1 hypothetical protein E4T46_03618 [Aureobasidium subglaciale]
MLRAIINWVTMANTDSNAFQAADFVSKAAHEQSQSLLFSVLPGEIRNQIWSYALADYQDETQVYDDATCYKRPEYLAPRKTDTVLLRTCKRIYQEAWFLPWTHAEQIFYLTGTDRRPLRTTTVRDMQRTLLTISKTQTMPIIQHVRVFAQLYLLENGTKLQDILNLSFFYPKSITITIRHTDWWFWESDNNLHFDATWVDFCRFPNSLTELRVAFESLERKKDQIDDVVNQAIRGWTFRCKDDTELSAKDCKPEIMKWSGNATWGGRRWVRDETGPNKLDYYVSTAIWRPVSSTSDNENGTPRTYVTEGRRFPNLDATGYAQLDDQIPWVPTSVMRNANMAPDAPTRDVRRLLEESSDEEGEERFRESDDDSEQDDIASEDEDL